MDEDTDDDEQSIIWLALYRRIQVVLNAFGVEDDFGRADFWIHEDNWGTRQQKVYISNLRLLAPDVIREVQNQLNDYPDWEIMVAVAVPGPGEAWPDMGLTIRCHEIIDGLQRHYFPPAYRHFQYPGSRPGTERD